MVSWDPELYGRFAAERARPFTDLLSRVQTTLGDDADPRVVVDVGCGSGELTATLARRWPRAQVLGVDSSTAMLERAARHRGDGLRFEQADARDWAPTAPVHVLVSNALLQWVPDHLELLRSWAGWLAPGGVLALQVPGNFASPSHTLMRQVAAEPPFEEALRGVLRGVESVAEPAEYAAALAGDGRTVDAWETTYVHVLDPEGDLTDHPVLAWVSGTGLRPVTDALADHPALRDAFVATYAERLSAAYPRRLWGTPFAFRRVFCVARAHAPAEGAPPPDDDGGPT